MKVFKLFLLLTVSSFIAGNIHILNSMSSDEEDSSSDEMDIEKGVSPLIKYFDYQNNILQVSEKNLTSKKFPTNLANLIKENELDLLKIKVDSTQTRSFGSSGSPTSVIKMITTLTKLLSKKKGEKAKETGYTAIIPSTQKECNKLKNKPGVIVIKMEKQKIYLIPDIPPKKKKCYQKCYSKLITPAKVVVFIFGVTYVLMAIINQGTELTDSFFGNSTAT